MTPTALGPTIWPAAKTIVNAAIPAGHAAGARLWRMSEVVEATSERKTAPNSRPEAKTASGCTLSTGSNVATATSAFSSASAPPPRDRCSNLAHNHDDATTAAPSITKKATTTAPASRSGRERDQSRGQQAARDERRGASDAGDKAKRVQRRVGDDEAVAEKRERRHRNAGEENSARAEPTQGVRRGERAGEVAGGVD